MLNRRRRQLYILLHLEWKRQLEENRIKLTTWTRCVTKEDCSKTKRTTLEKNFKNCRRCREKNDFRVGDTLVKLHYNNIQNMGGNG